MKNGPGLARESRKAMFTKKFALLIAGTVLVGSAPSALANYIPVDLSNYVNLGFTNSWFINGSEFSPIIGTTFGNQGSSVPFMVANSPDTSGQGGNNNFWFGLWGGPSNQLFGSPLSVTIPINVSGVTTVYTLADNTFGTAGNEEFDVTFTPTSGSPITGQYIGSNNTKDYNLNCNTTGCDTTPNAAYWFIDGNGIYPGDGQWLQVVGWTLPSNFGTLASVTLSQVDGVDGAIIAGLTLQGNPVATPEPASLALLSTCLGGAAFLLRRRLSRS
jgi:hypothetical protein